MQMKGKGRGTLAFFYAPTSPCLTTSRSRFPARSERIVGCVLSAF